jgi:hypothetical protein
MPAVGFNQPSPLAHEIDVETTVEMVYLVAGEPGDVAFQIAMVWSTAQVLVLDGDGLGSSHLTPIVEEAEATLELQIRLSRLFDDPGIDHPDRQLATGVNDRDPSREADLGSRQAHSPRESMEFASRPDRAAKALDNLRSKGGVPGKLK